MLIYNVKADVLLIMDCCNAMSAICLPEIEHPGTVVLWAACDPDMTTPLSGATSFTQNLINQLWRIKRQGRTVNDINTSVAYWMNHQQISSQYSTRNVSRCERLSGPEPYRPIMLKALVRPQQHPSSVDESTGVEVPNEAASRSATSTSPHISVTPKDSTQDRAPQERSVKAATPSRIQCKEEQSSM
jgi:hypothetical protein